MLNISFMQGMTPGLLDKVIDKLQQEGPAFPSELQYVQRLKEHRV